MKKTTKGLTKALLIASAAFNAFLLFLVMSLVAFNASHFAFLNFDSPSLRYLQSAFIVAVPSDGADLLFGPAEFSLKVGSEAALQFSLLSKGRQSNLAIDPLYDHKIVSVSQSGYGLIVRGLAAGEAVLQLFSPGGFRDIARVVVYE
jgi:hypothetical protein